MLVLEMLEGGDLFNRIAKRSVVTEKYLAVCFRSATQALQSIHERGYVHRDLKLDNIMCLAETEPTEVKIIDFGLMKGRHWHAFPCNKRSASQFVLLTMFSKIFRTPICLSKTRL